MKGTTHALVGGVVGALIGHRHPAVALVAGAASHVLLDVLPHQDEEGRARVIADVCGALAVLAAAVVSGQTGMAAGALGGILPDLENLPDILLGRKLRKIFPSHWRDHAGRARSWSVALETAILAAAALGLGLFLHRVGPSGALQ